MDLIQTKIIIKKLKASFSRKRAITLGKGAGVVVEKKAKNIQLSTINISTSASLRREGHSTSEHPISNNQSNWMFKEMVIGWLLNIEYWVLKTNLFSRILILSIALIFLALPTQTHASSSMDLSMFVMDKSTSKPLVGNQKVLFTIYEGENGKSIWEESQSVDLNYGLLKTSLGKEKSLPADMNPLDNDYYLGIKIGSDKELSPRKKISPNPFAVSAIYAQEAKTLEGKKIGKNEGNIVLLGNSGKIENAHLNTGENADQLVLGNDGRLHNKNQDTGTDSLNFNLGTGVGLNSGKNFNLTVSLVSTKPALRYNSTNSVWQLSNNGSDFGDIVVGSSLNDSIDDLEAQIAGKADLNHVHESGDLPLDSLTGDLLPTITDTYNLGSIAKRWNEVHAKTLRAETLIIEGDATLGSVGENITFNSPLIPSTTGLNLGSPTNTWANLYVDNLTVAATNTAGTTSAYFSINTEANDGDDSGLRFYRGPTLNSYATLFWDESEANFTFYTRENLSTLAGVNVKNLGIGTTSPSEELDVVGDIKVSGNLITSGLVDGKDIATYAGMLNEAETITANWINTDNPWADNEIVDNLTISGGTINNSTIGATTPSTGAFTTLSTTGITTIGENTATVAINSSDWDISTVGAMTGISGITNDGAYTQSGTSANTFTGVSTFSNANYSALFTGGNVGIGTLTPSSKLDVSGNGRFYDQTATTGSTTLTVRAGAGQATNVLQEWLDNSGNSLAVMSSDGRLGIGTTSPTAKLNVYKEGLFYAESTAILQGDAAGSALLQIDRGATSKLSGIKFSTGGTVNWFAGTYYNGGSAQSNFGIGSDYDVANQKLVIKTDGNVGIGTTGPAKKFHVYDSASVQVGLMQSGGASSLLSFQDAGTAADNTVRIGASGNDFIVSTNTAGAGATRLTVQGDGDVIVNSGNVGIGTTNPLSTFSVNKSGTGGYLPTSGTTPTNSIGQFKNSSVNNAMYFGTAGISPYGGWIQVSDVGNLSVQYPLLLNPNGGNVGIGTTIPQYKLSLGSTGDKIGYYSDATHYSNIMLFNGSTGAMVFDNYSGGGATAYQFNYAASPKFTIQQSGNVGIGTTTPQQKLELVTSSTGLGAKVFRLSNSNNTAYYTDFQQAWDDQAFAINVGGTNILRTYGYGDADEMAIGVKNYESTLYLKGGNVGIGTTSPSIRTGFGSPWLSISSTAPGISLIDSNNANTTRYIANSGGGMYIGKMNDDGTSPSDQMFISGTGNVGIGTTAPGAKLDVAGNIIISTAGSDLIVTDGRGIRAGTADDSDNQQVKFTGGGTFSNSRGSIIVLNGNEYASDAGWAMIRPGADAGMGIELDQTVYVKDGNVGIGTTAPGAKLDIADSFPVLRLTDSDNGAYSEIYSNLGVLVIKADPSNSVINSMIGFDTDGSRKMSILNDGNVGIGTTSPGALLHTSGSASGLLTGLRLENINTTAGSESRLEFKTAGDSIARSRAYITAKEDSADGGLLKFYTRKSGILDGKMVIDEDGNVGIGTTGPTSPLHVQGGAALANFSRTSGGDAEILIKADNGDPQITFNEVTGGTIYAIGVDDSNNAFTIASASALGSSEQLVIKSGNVGIGTTGPLSKLDVLANGTALTVADSFGVAGNFESATPTGQSSTVSLAGNDAAIAANIGGVLGFGGKYSGTGYANWASIKGLKTNATSGDYSGYLSFFTRLTGAGIVERMRIDNTGNVGIGTTAPLEGYKLTVSGLIHASGLVTTGVGSFPTTATNLIKAKSALTDIRISNNGDSEIMRITDAGNVGIGTTGPETLLDLQGGDLLLDNDRFIRFENTLGANTPVLGLNSVNNLIIGSGAGFTGDLILYSGGGNEGLRMDSAGNIGIGDTSPSYVLTVDHNGDGVDMAYVNDSNAWTSGSADYAEYYYTKDTNLKSGEAVCIDLITENSVKRCSRDGDSNIMGIVSTKPAFLGNAPAEEKRENNKNYIVVAMLGQVPAKVSSENGDINPGDSLAAASVDGFLRKAKAGESTVGVALETFKDQYSTSNNRVGEINVLISRKNKSLTVSEIEDKVSERVAQMEIEDEVNFLVEDAINNLDIENLVISLDERILSLELASSVNQENQINPVDLLDLKLVQKQQQTYLDELTETVDQNIELTEYLINETLERETRIQLLESQVAYLTEATLDEEQLEANNIDFFSLLLKENQNILGSLASNLTYATEGDNFSFNLDGELIVNIIKAEKAEFGEITVSGESAGRAKIEAGEKEVIIESSEINESSRVSITSKGNSYDKVLYYDEVIENESFIVKFNGEVLEEDLDFDWILIGEKY